MNDPSRNNTDFRRRRKITRLVLLFFVFVLVSFNFVDPELYLASPSLSLSSSSSLSLSIIDDRPFPDASPVGKVNNATTTTTTVSPRNDAVHRTTPGRRTSQHPTVRNTTNNNYDNTNNNTIGHRKNRPNYVPTFTNLDSKTARTKQKENDEKEDDPFARQNPIGKKWTSTRKFKNSNDWWHDSDSCFEVDRICRDSTKGGDSTKWFYYRTTSNGGDAQSTSSEEKEAPSLLFQPTMELKYVPYAYRKAVWADTRIQMKVHSSSSSSSSRVVSARDGAAAVGGDGGCRISDVPHHAVLQSAYNDMVGEFYVRTLLNLHVLLTAEYRNHRNANNANNAAATNLSPINATETQFYVHIPFEKPMLDAHKLLLSGILSSSSSRIGKEEGNHHARWAKSALDLVAPKEEGCQCFEKLVFCGYNAYSQQENVSNTPNKDPNNNNNSRPVPPSPVKKETTYTLWPGKYVDAFGHNTAELSSCNPTGADFKQYPHHCKAYAKLKTHLLANIEARHPNNLDEDIVQHRKQILTKRRYIHDGYKGDTKEWTFVGLAQRTSRRSWINLQNVTEACHTNFFARQNVICVEVNVEESASPQYQFLMHRSLDALIGIHGAQMTQAMLLPPNSHVLELLPWIPDYSRGDWTQRRNIPTPLGVIFHNSDLNHFGYSLDRSSVPLCHNSTREDEKYCFTKEKNGWKFQWDNRNFLVDVDVVIRFVNDYVLPMRKSPCKCKELLERQDERMVMYNVWCEAEIGSNNVGNDGASSRATSKNSSLAVRHYYRDPIRSNNIDLRPKKLEGDIFPRCRQPDITPTWNYYNILIHANQNTAERASRITANPPTQVVVKGEEEPRIPHRLIFTHKDNLFDCSKSTTKPELFNLAENAKATLNAYRRIWPDVDYTFLTDEDCIHALNQTEPDLIGWFNSGSLEGMYKADLCRAAYLFLHGGYYFDVDILVVRPYVAPKDARFVTVKGEKFPAEGFFQAFLAAEKGNAIIRRSLKIMREALWGERRRGKYLGPTALMEAWMEVEHVTNVWNVQNGKNDIHFLAEANLMNLKSTSKHVKLANVIASNDGMDLYQQVPVSGGDESCQFSSGACNVVVISELDETLYFFSRVLGTKWCGERLMDMGECTDKGVILGRINREKNG